MNTTTTLPPDISSQLEALRDIRLPGVVSWWPLAPGWWVLTGVLCLAVLVLLLLLRRQRRSLRALALRELANLREHLNTKANADRRSVPVSAQLASKLSALLRRVAIQQADGKRHAIAHGEAWSDYLSSGPGALPSNVAKLLAEGPYANIPSTTRRVADSSSDAANSTHVRFPDSPSEHLALTEQTVLDAAERWIRTHT